MAKEVVTLTLTDGNLDGWIKCRLENWNGLAFKFPREKLSAANSVKEFSEDGKCGIYLLFGPSHPPAKPCVYIGQAGYRENGKGILLRLQEHDRERKFSFWKETVVLISTDNTFESSDLNCLERSFADMARAAGHYEVKNKNLPHRGISTPEREIKTDKCIHNAELLFRILGYNGFVPEQRAAVHDPLPQPHSEPAAPAWKDGDVYVAKTDVRGSADARIQKISENKFRVLKGSKICKELTGSCDPKTKKRRKAAEEANEIDPDWRLKKDMDFVSPSGASAFVLGRSSSGYQDLTKDGIPLGETGARKPEREPEASPRLPSPPRSASPSLDGDLYHTKTDERGGADARAKRIRGTQPKPDGFLVLKGSKICRECTKSCPSLAKKLRHDNKEKGLIDESWRLTDDILFDSASSASDFVWGSSTNGNITWENKDGKKLGDVMKTEPSAMWMRPHEEVLENRGKKPR